MPYKDNRKRRQAQRKCYKKKKEVYLDRVALRKREIRAWFYNLKKTFSCEKCGENHPACLDFHHTDPSKKDSIVSHLVCQGYSKKVILREIEKCKILCSNCHRKLHDKRNG